MPQVGETTEQNNQTRRDEGPGAKAGAQHLTRPIAGPLRRPRSRRPKLTQPPRDQISRAVVAVLVAQQLGHPGCLDLRPLLEQTTQHRLERIELRGRRRSPITRRLLAPRQPGNRPPINPPADARSPAPRPRPAPTPAPAPTPTRSAPPHLSLDDTDPSSLKYEADERSAPRQVVHFSITDSGAVLDARRHRPAGARAAAGHLAAC